QALAGVYAVITGADCTGLKIGRRLYDMPILADGEVRFMGEKVAAVAGGTEEIARESLKLLESEYEGKEPLPKSPQTPQTRRETYSSRRRWLQRSAKTA